MSAKKHNPRSRLYAELTLPERDYPAYYRRVAALLEQQGLTTQRLMQNAIPVYTRLSGGNQRPPRTMESLRCRLGSILRRTIENPCGIKALQRIYRVKRRGYRVTPPKVCPAGGAFLRRSARLLQSMGLMASNPRGYYTTAKGKALLLQAKAQAHGS